MLGYGSHTEAPLTSFDPRNIPGNVPKPLRFLTGCLCFGFFFFWAREGEARYSHFLPLFHRNIIFFRTPFLSCLYVARGNSDPESYSGLFSPAAEDGSCIAFLREKTEPFHAYSPASNPHIYIFFVSFSCSLISFSDYVFASLLLLCIPILFVLFSFFLYFVTLV